MEYVVIAEFQDQRLTWPLPEGEILVGRGAECPARIPDYSVARIHVTIRRQGERIEIQDLGARNGTTVNGRSVTGTQQIHPGDVISIGVVSLRVEPAPAN